MTERCHSARAHDQAEARREQREDDDVGRQHHREAVDDEGQHEKHDSDDGERPHTVELRRRQRQDRRGRNALYRRLRAEQTPRPHDQHHRHDDELGRQRQLRERERNSEDVRVADADAPCLDDADDQGSHVRAGQAAEPTNHGHDEHVRDDGEVHRVVGCLPRQRQRTRETGKHRAKSEDTGEHQRLIDAESRRHLAILGRGAYACPPVGARQQ